MDFGRQIQKEAFLFGNGYTPLNHGSYGAFPKIVRAKQREIQDWTESRPDPFIRFSIPELLKDSRAAVATLLGAATEEVVFVPNATTGINTVLRNLVFSPGDIILYLNVAYGACEKTILHVCETTPAESVRIDVHFPIEDEELVDLFRKTAEELIANGKRVQIAMFDTVATFRGLRLPWEHLVSACRSLGILSLIDGAHGIGHIDLQHLSAVDPDFFTSNCYKWLYVPRPCAILYVPRRNQHLIRTTFPTSRGFQPLSRVQDALLALKNGEREDPLGDLFAWQATLDMSPYLCIKTALQFRSDVCGGEQQIRQYCFNLARCGGEIMAHRLGTESMDNKTETSSQCCFAMVRLPLTFKNGKYAAEIKRPDERLVAPEDGPSIVKWIMERLAIDYDTWVPGKFYNSAAWVRVSSQVYLDLQDFERAASALIALCNRVCSEEIEFPK